MQTVTRIVTPGCLKKIQQSWSHLCSLSVAPKDKKRRKDVKEQMQDYRKTGAENLFKGTGQWSGHTDQIEKHYYWATL